MKKLVFVVMALSAVFHGSVFAQVFPSSCIQSKSASATENCSDSAILPERPIYEISGMPFGATPNEAFEAYIPYYNLISGNSCPYTGFEAPSPIRHRVFSPTMAVRSSSTYLTGGCDPDPAVTYRLASSSVQCPSGWRMAETQTAGSNGYPGFCTWRVKAKNPKDLGKPSCDSSKGTKGQPFTENPINIATGNKYLFEVDYVGPTSSGLRVERHYNSLGNLSNMSIGSNWQHYYDRRVVVDSAGYANVARYDGRFLLFKPNGTAGFQPYDSDIKDTLAELKDAGGVRIGWRYFVLGTGELETYDANGLLTHVASKSGYSLTLSYSHFSTPVSVAPAQGLLVQVADGLGNTLNFTYDSASRISTMINPAGGVVTYQYDTNNNLASVSYPDGKIKTYHYENTTFKNALTGIFDENGSRYMSYIYSNNGEAAEEVSPSVGVNTHHNAISLSQGRGNGFFTANVVDALGTTRAYNFAVIAGTHRLTGTDQPAGAGCAASGSNITYDANGNIATKTDFNGHQTTYTYDMARNLQTSRTEGLATAGAPTSATRTITTSWHPTWRLPLVVSEYSGASASGTPIRTTTTDYDDKGNIISVSVADPVNNKTRTTTTSYTYSVYVPGLVLTKVVDGPRADLSDITTYQYYPHDETCTPSTATPIVDPITGVAPANLGCRGQLQSIANALNQTTTYDRYNHHGQVEQMTDPNGLVTENTYDLRQRITSRTVDAELTNLQYDAVGQLTQLTLPDGSQLAYSYDAAHRLTDITDNLGNTIHYTLDAQGNRINETIGDPSNQLTKTLTRSYDALNRLQQVTGVE